MSSPSDQTEAAPIHRGGPSTINGIMYQMLWSLLRAIRIHFDDTHFDDCGKQITRAVLRLEPPDGGDVQEVGPICRKVFQLKSRSTGKAWSLTAIVTDVLPDLYKSVSHDDDNSEYILVTESTMGQWHAAMSFFHSLNERTMTDDPISALDDDAEIAFRRRPRLHNVTWPLPKYTERSLFERIVELIRNSPAISENEAIEHTRRNTWNLLRGFVFDGQQEQEQLRREIRSLLLSVVDHREDIDEKQRSLTCRLMEIARGHAAGPLDTKTLLSQHGLDSVPLNQWAQLRQNGQRLIERGTRFRQYDPRYDVRIDHAKKLASEWSDSNCPILAITGETGAGKSWTLYALARALMRGPDMVVLEDATGESKEDLQTAGDCFWREIKENTKTIPLSRIAAYLRELMPRHPDIWLTILIDNIQDLDEAYGLIRTPLEDWGVRLAVTGPEHIIDELPSIGQDRVLRKTCTEFSDTERDAYLARQLGDKWPEIRYDVKQILCRPLLASLYCREVANTAGWHPTNEYQLFERFWNKLHAGRGSGFAEDSTRLARLAKGVLDGGPYPWPPAVVEQAGVDGEVIHRLIPAGWIRLGASNCYEVPHDRLLNFAIAHGLINDVLSNQMTLGELGKLLFQLLTERQIRAGRPVGYVLMDVIYLLSNTPGLAPMPGPQS
jgi:flagellar biosynthesis regulator FlaF